MKIRGKKISVHIPMAPPARIHGSPSGKKGYRRRESKRIERNAQENS